MIDFFKFRIYLEILGTSIFHSPDELVAADAAAAAAAAAAAKTAEDWFNVSVKPCEFELPEFVGLVDTGMLLAGCDGGLDGPVISPGLGLFPFEWLMLLFCECKDTKGGGGGSEICVCCWWFWNFASLNWKLSLLSKLEFEFEFACFWWVWFCVGCKSFWLTCVNWFECVLIICCDGWLVAIAVKAGIFEEAVAVLVDVDDGGSFWYPNVGLGIMFRFEIILFFMDKDCFVFFL